jgi:hypothetical protein
MYKFTFNYTGRRPAVKKWEIETNDFPAAYKAFWAMVAEKKLFKTIPGGGPIRIDTVYQTDNSGLFPVRSLVILEQFTDEELGTSDMGF